MAKSAAFLFRLVILIPLALVGLGGCVGERVERVEWPVMGTIAAVQWKTSNFVSRGEADHLVETVRQVFDDVERLMDAHSPESELSRLAGLSDEQVLAGCQPSMRLCYAAAFKLRDETGRVFNPRWRGPGTLDLGAIAKGYAVDLAAKEVASRCGETEVLIDLGGNLKAVRGTWTTGITDPNQTDREDARVFELKEGMACATSGEYFRGCHIRDGRDGSAVSGRTASVTVVHTTSALLADGLSTTMFLLGREKGEAFLARHYPEAKAIWFERGKKEAK